MTFKERADKLAAELKEPRKPRGTWPLKETFKHTNKEIVANARALQLNDAIDVLVLRMQDISMSPETLAILGAQLVELQKQYQRLQERFFTGDGRSSRKNRGKKTKVGSVNHLLK
jgi:hypothetical protein